MRYLRNPCVAVNIAADGIQSEIIFDTSKTREEYRLIAENYVQKYLLNTCVGKMIFNVCYKRSITDSEVFDSVLYNVKNSVKSISPAASETDILNNFREMIRRGIDIIEILVATVKKHGAEAWLSVRMNDHHFPNDKGFNSTISYERYEELGVNDSRTYLDHTKQAVQEYYTAYICELCQKYDIDGIELDFLRSAPIMSEVNTVNIEKVNDYVKRIRNGINTVAARKGVNIGLSARVYSTPEHNDSFGLDSAQWVAEGSIDSLTVSGWYIPTYYDIPVKSWKKRIDTLNTDKNKYTLLCGTDWAVRCDSTSNEGYIMWITLEQIKGFTSASYAKGADGIYFFNHFLPESDQGAITYYLNENEEINPRNVLKEKLNSASSLDLAEVGECSYVNTCRDYSNTVYPIEVTDKNNYTAVINTGTAYGLKYYSIIIGSTDGSSELTVAVNGKETEKGVEISKPKDFVWKIGEVSEPVARHISEVAPRVKEYRFTQLDLLSNGENAITVSSEHATLKWIEVRAVR